MKLIKNPNNRLINIEPFTVSKLTSVTKMVYKKDSMWFW